MKGLCLVVDDEPDICDLVKMALKDMAEVDTAGSLQEARQKLAQKKYQVCLTDLRLPDGLGTELIEKCLPRTPIAVLTAHGNVEAAVNALKAGAFDFLSKPVNFEDLRKIVKTALLAPGADKPQLSGESEVIKNLCNMITKVARSDAPIYIYGPSGCGKERVAREIHAKSPRHKGPFVPINCGAIAPELMESELFGHKKGSFTGAHQNELGVFRAAEDGTLFLDEIAELPLSMQVKLLRAIQERAVRPVGEAQEISINARIICATHQNLSKRVAQGEFREDLYYRLNVIPIEVPALRTRIEDIPILIEELLADICARSETPMRQLAPAALEKLLTYDYPGNVRELENILERAVALSGNVIQEEDISLPSGHTEPKENNNEDLDAHLADVERTAIVHALAATDNFQEAADNLGISTRSLRYRIKKLGINEKR